MDIPVNVSKVGDRHPLITNIFEEIKKQTGNFTVIGIPVAPNELINLRLALWVSKMACRPNIIANYQVSRFCSQGMNETIHFVLEQMKEATHLLLVSSDEIPKRDDALDLMLALNKDVVVGPTPIMFKGSICWNMSHYTERGVTEPFDPIDYMDLPRKPFRVYDSGGPYLIKREALEKLEWPYFRDIWNKDDSKRKVGQDIYFTRKVINSGFEIWCEPKAIFEHHKNIDLGKLAEFLLDKTSNYYDRIYESSKDYRCYYKKSFYYDFWSEIVKIVKKNHNKKTKILEIGCGAGQLAHYLYDEGYKKYYGFDFSPEAIKIAKKNCSRQKFKIADITDKDAYNYDYELVLAVEVLEHLNRDISLIRSLKKGTPIIFTLPSFDEASHKRFFRNLEQIYERYMSCIDNLVIKPYKRFFICSGVVR